MSKSFNIADVEDLKAAVQVVAEIKRHIRSAESLVDSLIPLMPDADNHAFDLMLDTKSRLSLCVDDVSKVYAMVAPAAFGNAS